MESDLYKASLQGDVSCLVALLNEDALVLDRIIAGQYRETPLHIAAMLGHVEFVREVLIRKPMLASELDSHGASPLHLASAKGYVVIVKELLLIEPEMCFVRDKYRRNPLHIAAARGRVEVLKELVQQRPGAAFDKLENNDTIMHLCVKYYRLESLKILITYVDINNELINSKNDDGNTILHVAALENQIETIEFLISKTAIEVDATNQKGLTAFDLLPQSCEIPPRCMERTNAPRAQNRTELALLMSETIEPLETKSSMKELFSVGNRKSQTYFKREDDWLERKRNALMVVASLIATMAFQVGVNHPEHPAWQNCLVYNTIGFTASLSIILLLVSGLPFKSKLLLWILRVIIWVAIISMGLAYSFCIASIGSYTSSISIVGILVWIGLMILLFLGHTIFMLMKGVHYLRKRSCLNGVGNSF